MTTDFNQAMKDLATQSFVMTDFHDTDKVQTKYRVLSYEGEGPLFWRFEAKPILTRRYHKILTIRNGKSTYWVFPKRKEKGKDSDGNTIWEDLDPPRFLDELRDKAIKEGHYQMPGGDSPTYTNQGLFKEKNHDV